MEIRFKLNKRKLLILLPCLLLLAGGAYAAWTITASGTGKYAAASISAPVTANGASPVGDLVPGGDGALDVKLSNPNSYALTLTNISGGSIMPDNTGACPALNLSVNTSSTYSVTIPANSPSADFLIPKAIHMAPTAPNGCQGATGQVQNLTMTFSPVAGP